MSAKWPPLRYCLFAFSLNGMLLQIPMQQTAKPWHSDLLQLGNILIPVLWGFFGKAAPGCCPHDAKPCCWRELWLHMPCLWDLAPGASVYLAGSLNFSSSSALSLAALAFVLDNSPLCSCRWAARVGWRPTQATVPISACYSINYAGGSLLHCTSCFPQTWYFVGFWAHQRSGTAWTNM